MIVGNGDVADEAAAVIDRCDVVIRFNGCRNFGVAGCRTDVIALCNTGRPAKALLDSESWRDSAPVKAAQALWMVRDPAKFASLQADILADYPELDDFFDDYTGDFADFCAARGKQHRVLAAAVHEAADHALSEFSPAPYVVPSSGMIVISHMLDQPEHRQDDIVLVGFSHTGWDGHPFAAEERLINRYIAEGRLSRFGVAPSSTSQGDV
nr:Urease operon accessory protein [Allorhizobium sonneratiae]